MKIYDWQQIKDKADCVALCEQQLGMKRQGQSGEWVRFNNPWRAGSDSGAFSVRKSGYKDHVSGESGSALDLIANAKFSGDLWAAQEFLGELLELDPAQQAKTKRRFVCAYDYRDLTGNLVHQTVRWEPKEFTQRRPDPKRAGKWIYNLTGITPILYRESDWCKSDWVCVVGGEKDADRLLAMDVPATTNPMGEGNWREHYNQSFKGKFVCILPDNDEPGRKHAEVVTFALRKFAKRIKIVVLPDLPKKGDVSDWVDAGGTRDQLLAIIKAANPIDTGNLDAPKITQKEISDAKKANQVPFRNFDLVARCDARGKEKQMKQPRHINAMIADVKRRFWGFPRRVGSTMFDLDRITNEIRYIESPAELIGWIAEKSGHVVEWAKNLDGGLTYEQFYGSIKANAKMHDMVSDVPHWPMREDVFYKCGKLPDATEDAKYFNEFCNFFSPATEQDAQLLRVFIASPLYFKPHVDRPLWIIDAKEGQGVGKTKLVQMVASLYGTVSSGGDSKSGATIDVDYKQLGNETTLDRITRRLLSRSGREKRILLLDNVIGYFKCPALATLLTQNTISGMAPYGRGEETRQNDLMYVITSNSASVDRDLVSRAFFITLKMPEDPRARWATEIMQYINEYRLHIIADMIGILEHGASFEFRPATRFRTWEIEVLAPMIGSLGAYSEAFKRNLQRQEDADGEVDEANTLRDHFAQRLRDQGIDPDNECVWIQTAIINQWAGEAIDGFGGRTNRNAVNIIRNMIRATMFPELSEEIRIYPHKGKGRRRGLMWNMAQYKAPDWVGIPAVLKRGKEGEILKVYPHPNEEGSR